MASQRTYRVAVMGRTGGGGFGHGLEKAFVGLERAEIVAVSDPDPEGRKQAMERTGAPRAYPHFGEMLDQEEPDITVVGPRYIDCHEEMVTAALEAGAHVYCEKPFAQTLEQADRMLALAAGKGLKVGVALPFVHEPRCAAFLELIEEGLIGEVRLLKAFTKHDHRGGGDDWAILGPHLVDMMRRLAGNPDWGYGFVGQGEREITPGDAARGRDEVGPVAGDRIVAFYHFASGITGTMESWQLYLKGEEQPYRLEVHGSEGILMVKAPYSNHSIWHYPKPFIAAGEDVWRPIETEPITSREYHPLAARDFIDAIEEDREPLCSGDDGRWALEMILMPYASQLRGERIALPMEDRLHPLAGR